MDGTPPGSSAMGTILNALERLSLFALSLAVGLINLAIALVVASHLGIVPKAPAARIIRLTNQATLCLTKAMGPAHRQNTRR